MFQILRLNFSNRSTIHNVIIEVRRGFVIKDWQSNWNILKLVFHTVVQRGF